MKVNKMCVFDTSTQATLRYYDYLIFMTLVQNQY
jgi:hypothetical protein